tara:strand:- start:64 stop:1224 length:1161 start_codon:yes stop_codon:yes gene_type:complete
MEVLVVKMHFKKKFKNESGLTLIEILIGIVITSLMMGAMYTSYNVVNKTYNQVSEKAKISKTSRDLVTMLMRDVRMAGYKYYAGSHTIQKFAEATDTCANGVALPKTSYFPFENGYDNESKSHNPIVIRKKLLGNNKIPLEATLKAPFSNRTQRWTEYNGSLIDKLSTDMCCDQIEIVYEDFNQNDLLQPFKKYRITYYAEKTGTVDEPSYGVFKSLEYWYQARSVGDCIWPSTSPDGWITDKTNDAGDRICPECIKRELIRDNVVDMEFIPFDQYGVVIKSNTSGEYPRPIPQGGDASIRDRLFDIRGVDIRLTFTTKDNFFTRIPKNKRKPLELLSDRKPSTGTTTGVDTNNTNTNNTNAAGDLKLRDSVVVTVYARNIGKDLF